MKTIGMTLIRHLSLNEKSRYQAVKYSSDLTTDAEISIKLICLIGLKLITKKPGSVDQFDITKNMYEFEMDTKIPEWRNRRLDRILL